MPLDTGITRVTTYGAPTALAIPGYVLAPTGGRLFYVRSTGRQSYDPPALDNILLTINSAMALCRADQGDTIIVLPGHVESTSSTDVFSSLVAGVRIIGVGTGSNRPTITLTGATAQIGLDAANVFIENILFSLTGANNITKAINVTAADVVFSRCEFITASGASNDAAIALELGSGANRARIIGCKFRSSANAGTDMIKVAAAVDNVEITDCVFTAAGHVTNGHIHVTAAATSLVIARNIMFNQTASSQACVYFDDVAATGIVSDCRAGVLNGGTAANQGVMFAGTTTLAGVRVAETYTSDEAAKNAVLSPGASS